MAWKRSTVRTRPGPPNVSNTYRPRLPGTHSPESRWVRMTNVERSRRVVVIFDGECVFCNRWVDFLLRFDRQDVFRFAARETESGASFIRQAGLPECGVG